MHFMWALGKKGLGLGVNSRTKDFDGLGLLTTQKIENFLLVTRSLTAHSGQSEFFQNCVGEFGIDTG